MKFDRTGIILYTLEYKACVEFYKNILKLPILFSEDALTCFEFGPSYLMVEVDDEFNGTAPSIERTRTCLRLNVPDVKACANELTASGVEVNYQEHNWGTIAKFHDPDGNLIAFKDSESSEKQIEAFSKANEK